MRVGAAHESVGAPPLVERLRVVHLKMVDAVLAGEGLGRVAELAAVAAGSPVAIVIPRLGPAALSPGTTTDVGALRRYVSDRQRGRPASVPPEIGGGGPIAPGGGANRRRVLVRGARAEG